MAESKKYRIYLVTLFGKDLDIKSFDVVVLLVDRYC